MAATKRRQIIEAFRDRLSAITLAGNFNTDVGRVIYLGEQPTLGAQDPAAIAITVEEDAPDPGQGLGGGANAAVKTELPVSIHALVFADIEAPLVAIEDVIGDIKKAVELADRTLGGLVGELTRGPVRPLEREEGSVVVGATAEYRVVYSEGWGSP